MITLTRETAIEVKSAIQAKLEELEELGVYMDTKGIYFNDDSFFITVQGCTDKEKEFETKPAQKRIYLS